MKSKSMFAITRSILSTPSSSKRHLQIGMLNAITIAAICTDATNATAATLTYFTDLASFNAASSISAVDDFESGTPKNVSDVKSFVRNGNTFSTNLRDVIIASPGYTNFGTPKTTTSILTADGKEDFNITFGTPKSAVGIFGSGGLLGTYSVNQDSTKVGFFGVVASAPITSIRWTGANSQTLNTGIDNLRTQSFAAATPTTSVPEPFTIIGTLVGGTAAIRMRKKLKSDSIL